MASSAELSATLTSSDMQVEMSVVLFVAERRQNLAPTMRINNLSRDILRDPQQFGPQHRVQLQQ
ncbi:hypothetical protein [Nocardia sp. NPDC004722]